MHVCVFSHVRLFATLWTAAHQSSVPGISQARTLKWVAIPFSRGSSQPRDWTHISCIDRILYPCATREAQWYYACFICLSRLRLFVTPRTVTPQAPLSMGFSRQEYWSGVSFSSPISPIILWSGSNLIYLWTQTNSLNKLFVKCKLCSELCASGPFPHTF